MVKEVLNYVLFFYLVRYFIVFIVELKQTNTMVAPGNFQVNDIHLPGAYTI